MSRYPGWREANLAIAGGAAPAKNKFNARKTTIDGHTFDSAHEARIWQELCLELIAGDITDLTRQRHFPLFVKAKDGLPFYLGRYTCDFLCKRDGQIQVIDAKSRATRTEAYQLRKKLFEALYGLKIHER